MHKTKEPPRPRHEREAHGSPQASQIREGLALDDQLCFPLYVCARKMVNAYAPYLSEIGLTYTQYVTMLVMWEEGQVVTRRLRERLFLDSGTLTPVLRKLEEKGLITKERSTQDARDLVVTITQAGRELEARAALVPGQVSLCVAGFERGEELMDLLGEMMDMFRERRKALGK